MDAPCDKGLIGASRLTALLLVMTAVGAGLTVGATVASAAIIDPFSPMFSQNTTGDIQIRGNTLMACQDAATMCAGGRANLNVNNNNSFFMTYIDVDSDISTFDS